jgi:heme-degrading monooxygenase HmoA
MIYIHVAIYRWKADASTDAVNRALIQIENLAGKVPGILDISVGENHSKYSEGYSHIVLVRGSSQEAIDKYRQHPEHQEAAAVLDEAEDHGIGVDFVTGEFAEKVAHG